jgi:O-antigen ligase
MAPFPSRAAFPASARRATATPFPASPLALAQSNPAFIFAALLLFTHFARPFDVVLVGYKIPAIICSACIVVAIVTGGMKELRSRVGAALLLLVAWMCISAPFSFWKGGTFMYVMWYAQFFFPLMLLVAVASKTPKDMLKLCGVVAFSCFCHLLNGTEQYGRFGLKGTFGNPDDVALLSGFTMPFLILICGRLRNAVLRYVLLAGGCGYLLFLTGRTGTRAAIPALLAMLAIYFIRSKGVQRVAILIGAVFIGFIVVAALPASTLERLSTVLYAFNPKSTVGTNEAEGSALERHDLMRDAVKIAIAHPIVGVGAGMFMQYRWDKLLRADGLHKSYIPAHNSYLEIASECGIPGVIFYVLFLWIIHRQIRIMQKLTVARSTPQTDMLWSVCLCVEAALVYFVVCAAFMTCDRHPHQFLLAGFAIALQRMARSSTLMGTPTAAPPLMNPLMPAVPFVGKRPFPIAAR